LIDKVYATANLDAAFTKVAANKGAAGVDHVTTREFDRQRETNLGKIQQQLQAGTYRPQEVRRVWIPKPGSQERRPLGIPTVRDRTVQAALRHVIEPIFEQGFAEQSYGFRPRRTTPGGPAAQARLRMDRGCRSERILRHDSPR
jgi:RNA-directed DNA polymerase